MTVVVGFNWLSEVVMISDTRVSWPDNRYPPRDALKKLYAVGDADKSAILGFSGNLQDAREVIVFLMQEKLKNYKRSFVISQFKEELRRWIEEVTITRLKPGVRTNLQFMLCGIEPSRHPPIVSNGQVTGHTPFVEAHIYKYTIGKTGKVTVNVKPTSFDIIGVGQEQEEVIFERVQQAFKFGHRSPNLQWARAFVMGDIIASLFEVNRSTTVGGLFQVVRITPNGLEPQFVWPPSSKAQDMEVLNDGAKVVVRNPTSGESYTLYPVWDPVWDPVWESPSSHE
jgi:hypothetical protein